jgi:helicase
VVYVLVEPDCRYHHSMEMTEDEVAFTLLKGEMEDVDTVYDEATAAEETLANLVVAGGATKRLNERMVGEVDTERAVARLLDWGFIDGLDPTPLGRAVTEHFLAPRQAFRLLDAVRRGAEPWEIVAETELADEE